MNEALQVGIILVMAATLFNRFKRDNKEELREKICMMLGYDDGVRGRQVAGSSPLIDEHDIDQLVQRVSEEKAQLHPTIYWALMSVGFLAVIVLMFF